ncbi:MAG: hypothetical protein HQL64_12455 [Magnetococcales bacterium]|nr:hypothetical protein [Magnetococcales bacterium]
MKKDNHDDTDHKILSLVYVQTALLRSLAVSGALKKDDFIQQLMGARSNLQRHGLECAIPAFDDLCDSFVHVFDTGRTSQ